MICKVVSAALVYNGRVYREGSEIDVDTASEVKRLTGYGVIVPGLEKPPEPHSLDKRPLKMEKPAVVGIPNKSEVSDTKSQKSKVKKRNGQNDDKL